MRANLLRWFLLFLLVSAVFQLPAQQSEADGKLLADVRAKAEKGDAGAQFYLGLGYGTGRGVAKDEVGAVKWYRRAAEQGHAKAQYFLGTCYENGQGVSKDEAEAMKWYRAAAKQNVAAAEYNLGVYYRDGQGVMKDLAEAVNWFRKAAEQNLAVAQYNLGVCYRDGQGVSKDEEEAVVWFRRAADQNLAVAQYNLGVCYDNGQGVGKDYLKAVKWYRKAADQNLAYAQSNLGAHYEHGTGVAEDGEEAVKWYRKAVEQNYATAQFNLGAHYANGQGVAKDEAEAVKWYRKAAGQNHAFAQCNLGVCYANGQGVAKDSVEAVKWFRKAADQNDSAAQYGLGFCYYNGQGVKQNNTEAYIWFSLSATKGDVDASQARNSIASHLSRAEIAEAQKRIAAFVPRNDNTEQEGLTSLNSKLTQRDILLLRPVTSSGDVAAAEQGHVASQSSISNQHSAAPLQQNETPLIPTPGTELYTLTPADVKAPAEQGYATSTLSKQVLVETEEAKGQREKLARRNNQRPLTPEEAAYARSQGLDPNGLVAETPVQSVRTEPQKTSATPTPPDLKNAIIYMDSFLGMPNQMLLGDVITMKAGALKFRFNEQDWDHSGHYTVVLDAPRKHRNPRFGFGTPDKAKLIIIGDFGGKSMPLPDATIWEKSSGFIDVEALGKEWIYSGTYTIQN
jgi:TPR repeat protein